MKPPPTAWQIMRAMKSRFGRRFSECLYSWFSEASRTFSYAGSGIQLLLQCDEDQAIDVMREALKMLEAGQEYFDWEPFVAARDWPVHQAYHHPSKRFREIWGVKEGPLTRRKPLKP